MCDQELERPRSLIVEDQTLFSGFLAQAIQIDERFGDVQTASTVGEVLSLLEQNESFDVYWLDLHLPDGWGMDLADRLMNHNPKARIAFISGHGDPAAIRQALLKNYKVFISKEEPLEIFDEAMNAILEGRIFYSPRILRILGDLEGQAMNWLR